MAPDRPHNVQMAKLVELKVYFHSEESKRLICQLRSQGEEFLLPFRRAAFLFDLRLQVIR